MDFKNAQILITGGSEGIGKGLAALFIKAGSKVLVTGRNAEKLKSAANDIPGLQTYVNNIGDPSQRELLAQHIRKIMPGLNVIINNAGIQRRVSLASDNAPWTERQAEIDILLSAPVHLNHLLIPTLLNGNKQSLVVNVSSGGAFIPQVFAPIYSACKAAVHSYTMVLRHSLANTNCRVVELVPPAVQTALAGPGLNHGSPLDEFCNTVFNKLILGEDDEIGFGPTENLAVELSGKSLKDIFTASSTRFPVEVYTS